MVQMVLAGRAGGPNVRTWGFVGFLCLMWGLFLWAKCEEKIVSFEHVLFVGYVGIGTAVLSFVHEGFAFFCAVPLALIVYNHFAHFVPRACGAMATTYLIADVAVFVVSIIFKGDADVMQAIWQNIGDINRAIISADGKPSGGIETLGMSLWEGLALPVSIITSGMAWYWLVPVLSSATLCAYVAVGIWDDGQSSRRYLTARALVLYGVIGAGTIPLFVFGWDWGRWIVAINLGFLFTFERLQHLPTALETLAIRLAHHLPSIPFHVPASAIGIGLLVFELTIRLPGCCITAGRGEPFDYTFWNIISLIRSGHGI